ncbi:MAG: non-ribosomal peptide synthetase [Granulicella sp.]
MGITSNPTFRPTPNLPFATVHVQFLHSAAFNGYAVAIVQGEESLTYSELLQRSLAFASVCAAAGVKKGTLVSLDAGRSIDTVVGILGILFAGGVYVPIQRCDAGSAALLTRHNIRFLVSGNQEPLFGADLCILSVEKLTFRRPIQIFDLPGEACGLDDPAYILFTSGSTGARKGVIIPHRGILRLVNDQNFISMARSECTLLHSPLTFDASTLEIWAVLLRGGTLVLAPDRPLAVEDFRNLVLQHNVTTLWLTAGLFHFVAQHNIETFGPLRQLVVGGDVIHADLFAAVKRRFPRLRLVNGYGPTENTTFTTCYVATEGFCEGKVPIGEPINGTTLVILDDAGVPVSEGTPGELATGGAGVALGYLDDDALTAKRFLPDFSCSDESARLYLTGDIVRRNEDGQLEFLGRKDSEVKIAGQRIQLDEVEHVILSYERVSACATLSVDLAADKFLVAFIVWRNGEDEESLRILMKSALMPAAIPRALRSVESLPLTDNGKIDRAELRRQFLRSTPAKLAPKAIADSDTSMQWLRATERIWSAILHRQIIDPQANFFDLGGDSLGLICMQAELQRLSPRAPSLVELFSLPNVKSIADYMNAVAASKETGLSDHSQQLSLDGELGVAGRFI